jgi:hypothetical protein
MSQTIKRKAPGARKVAEQQGKARKARAARARTGSAIDAVMAWLPFSDEQLSWLAMMRDHIATSLEIQLDDLDYAPFAEAGGLGKAVQVFGSGLREVIGELNEVLAA